MPSSTFAADPEPPVSRARRRRRQRRRNGGSTLGGSNATESVMDSVEDNSSVEDHSEHVMQSGTDMNPGGDSFSSTHHYNICVN